MNVTKARENYRVIPHGGPRTLVLTHLRGGQSHNTRVCRKLWEVADPVFPNRSPFDHRLYLKENHTDFLEQVELRLGQDDKVFSASGSLHDRTPPTGYENSTHIFVPASERGFVGPGRHLFFLGGGNLKFCLADTFESIILAKGEQGERVQIVITTPLAYTAKAMDRSGYVKNPNEFSKILEGRDHRIAVDGELIADESGKNPVVELHWFSSVTTMFASPFFPELQDTTAFSRVINYFMHI
ncbi:MAG: hypothetical protein U9R38_05545 [Candidatus Margulisiibacteriota bacterium]|nr:hypothetical protein [Candidatus Margulisiibacteriota bacterium]